MSFMPKFKKGSMKPPEQDDGIFFPRKLKGAHARLFAAACVAYIEAATNECNDTDSALPVWCGLSPYQRIHLVKEIMIGLLCDEEPIPQTAQHFVAYMGIWKTINMELEMEMDSEGGTGSEMVDAILESCPPDPEATNVVKLSEEERNERLRKNAVRAKIAAKTKKKLSKKMEGQPIVGVDAKNSNGMMDEEDSMSKGSPHEKIMENLNPLDIYSKYFIERSKFIFEGGPPPQESRTYLRPNMKPYNNNGNDDDNDSSSYWEFNWRILCDDAFQEHTDPSILCPLPLCYLNFNWKYSENYEKWHRALYILMIESNFINYHAFAKDILPLHFGEIDDAQYANPKHHQRIMNVTNIIKDWRGEYDESWDSSRQALDQRCIFAVCSIEVFGDRSQRLWINEFLKRCSEEKVDFLEAGNYQARLGIHRSLENFDPDGLKNLYMNAGHSELCHPRLYQAEDQFYSMYDMCNANMCFSGGKLSKCARW